MHPRHVQCVWLTPAYSEKCETLARCEIRLELGALRRLKYENIQYVVDSVTGSNW